jgi:hypothetical protein
MKKSDLLKLERFAEKSAQNIIEAIEKSKSRPFAKLINALGIPNVGLNTAEILAEHFPNMHQLVHARIEKLSNIHAIGPKIAHSIWDFFSNSNNTNMIERLMHAGVNMGTIIIRMNRSKLPLYGKSFVITGTLSKPRTEIEEKIKSLGGRISSSVSKNTACVIVGSDPGSKYEKAKDGKIPLLSDEEYFYIFDRMTWITKFGGISQEYIEDHSRAEVEKAVKKAIETYEKSGKLTHLTNMPLREDVQKEIEEIIGNRFPKKKYGEGIGSEGNRREGV